LPPNLQPRESEIVDAVLQLEKFIRGEPLESCKLRYFHSFKFLTIRPFVRAVEALGLDWVNLKENQPELLAEAQRLTAGPAPNRQPLDKDELQLWHAPEVYWPRRRPQRPGSQNGPHSTEEANTGGPLNDGGRRRPQKEMVVEQSTHFYASNLELGTIPPVFVHQLGRSRWVIDTEVFQTITTDGHLKKPSVHQGRGQALIVLTMIRVLAYTLTLVFFHRQVRSHFRNCSFGFCDLAHRLAYQFVVTAQPDSS